MKQGSNFQSEEAIGHLLFEAQSTIGRTPSADDVFDLVRQFIHLYGQLQTKPAGAALLYQECASDSVHYHDLDRELIVGRLRKSDRNPHASDVALDDAQMSRTHFAISLSDGFYFVRDLGSRNGTYLNNLPRKIENEILKAGDVILAGSSLFVFTGPNFVTPARPFVQDDQA